MFENKIVPQEVADARLAICQSCQYSKLGICAKCGCVLKLKTQVSASKCPIDKWDKWIPVDKESS